jgi:hypothetical protein
MPPVATTTAARRHSYPAAPFIDAPALVALPSSLNADSRDQALPRPRYPLQGLKPLNFSAFCLSDLKVRPPEFLYSVGAFSPRASETWLCSRL